MLTQSLREMETDGLVCRQTYATNPQTVTYHLTPLSKDFVHVMRELFDWGSRLQELDQEKTPSREG